MKRICILLMGAAVFLSSCNTVNKTARTADTQSSLKSATVVDIVPATEQRVTHTVHPSKALLRGGENNVKQAVEHEALVKYGNADILLEPQYIVEKERRLFRTKITSVTVSGRPAYYTNYRALHDSVWANPVFNGLSLPPSKAMPFVGNKMGSVGLKRNPSKTPAYRTKGFAMYLSPFVGGGDISCDHGSRSDASWAALFTFGYQFNPYFYVGAGLGVNGVGGGSIYYDDHHPELRGTYIPLYGNLRVNLSKKKNTPFLDWKMGCGLGGNTNAVGHGNLLQACSVGYSWGDFDVAFQYLFHDGYYDHEYSKYGGLDYIAVRQWGVSFGFRF